MDENHPLLSSSTAWTEPTPPTPVATTRTVEDVDALVDSREAVRALAAALGNVDGASSGTTLFVILGTQQAG